MFYEIEVHGHIRVEPKLFGEDTKKSVRDSLIKMFDGFISRDLGIVIEVTDVTSIGEGIVIPGDGAAYYDTTFKIMSYKPEVQEVVLGKISDITDFGAFINIGPLDGMIHVSQTMDDYVSFSKSNILTGKESKRNLKVGDPCRARIVSVSYKDISNPKIGLTMRQHRLGVFNWIDEDLKKETKKVKAVKK
ncbi:DNA-directed RNA polymerase [archaeon]|jgi:DNA-directed RNA polymerase subunit E'|nr:DNA-directed RNA polymerase [archaeon]MBT4396725.1 DNA-directed RNA polymerase [archaeon]MBT4441335.1 DNA-directed RNA polymerase [archaeon]